MTIPQKPIMYPVESSHIESIGHSPQGDLLVVYKGSPKVYAHPNVSAEKFEEIKGADSVGKAIRQLGKGREMPEDWWSKVLEGE